MVLCSTMTQSKTFLDYNEKKYLFAEKKTKKHIKSIFQMYLLLILLQNSSWARNLIFLCLTFLSEKWQ